MSRVCDVTGRKPMFGNNVSFFENVFGQEWARRGSSGQN